MNFLSDLEKIQGGVSELYDFLSVGRTYNEIEKKLSQSQGTIFKKIATLQNFGLVESKRVGNDRNKQALYYRVQYKVAPEHFRFLVSRILGGLDKYSARDYRRYEDASRAAHLQRFAMSEGGGYRMQGIRAKAEYDLNRMRTEVLQLATFWAHEYGRTHGGKRRSFISYKNPLDSKNWRYFARIVSMCREYELNADDRKLFVESLFSHYGWKGKYGKIYPFPSMVATKRSFEIYATYIEVKQDMYNSNKVRKEPGVDEVAQRQIVNTALDLYDTYEDVVLSGRGELKSMKDVIKWSARFGSLPDIFIEASTTARSLKACKGLRQQFLKRWNHKHFETCIELTLPKIKARAREQIRSRHGGKLDEKIFSAMW